MPRQNRPKRHLRLKRGDQVRVIAGKDRGREGEIIEVLPEKNRVVVKNVNVVKKTMRPTQENPYGGFSEREMPLDASNVQLLDPETKQPSRIGYRMHEGRKQRISLKSGSVLDREEA